MHCASLTQSTSCAVRSKREPRCDSKKYLEPDFDDIDFWPRNQTLETDELINLITSPTAPVEKMKRKYEKKVLH